MKTKIFPFILPKHKGLFEFGISALTLQRFASLNSNARQVIENVSTAHSKIYRLVRNPKMLLNFHNLICKLDFIKRNSLVNVDFSSFCGFETLGFAVQTQNGRALPVWVDCLTYPIEKPGSQNLFIIKKLKAFKKALGFYPGFVLDRGFMIPILIQFMLVEKIIFYLRIKKGKSLLWVDKKGNPRKLSALKIGKKTKDTFIWLYGKKARLVISRLPKRDKRSDHKLEPWYILTTDFKSTREEVLNVYKARFEIEESFKDLKHLFGLKKFTIKEKQTFLILLWFEIIGFWLSFWCTNTKKKRKLILVNCKKALSYPRLWFESLQRQVRQKLIFNTLPT